MNRLISVNSENEIPQDYKDNSVGKLLRYHNLTEPFTRYDKPEMIIGMCMDNRKMLRVPDNFAFILRTGGANLRYSDFKVSFAIAIGEVDALALIGHDDCGMVNLMSKREKFISGLVERAGWSEQEAADHFMSYAPFFEIHNEIDFMILEAKRIRTRYPKLLVAPLFYKVEDNRLYVIEETIDRV